MLGRHPQSAIGDTVDLAGGRAGIGGLFGFLRLHPATVFMGIPAVSSWVSKRSVTSHFVHLDTSWPRLARDVPCFNDAALPGWIPSWS